MQEDFTVGIAGLGLIGGSFAKAIRRDIGCRVVGFDLDSGVMELAYAEGMIASPTLQPHKLRECEVVLVCLHPKATVRFVQEHLDFFRPGTLLMDVCGVKNGVSEKIRGLIGEKELCYISTHPMAGREFTGYRYSLASLFDGASLILSPGEGTQPDAEDRARGFFSRLGFGDIVLASEQEHDRIISYTSQLPHIISNAYVKSDNFAYHRGFTAGSFADMSRVARMEVPMWTELFLYNRENLSKEIGDLIRHLGEYKQALDSGDAEQLAKLLRAGHLRKTGDPT